MKIDLINWQIVRSILQSLEDSEATAALYEEYLRSADYRVKIAGTVAAALTLLGSERFDAVVLDLNLPDGNGLSVLKEIKRQDLPIETLVVTATGTLAVAVEAMREGAFDFVVKPFARDRLLVTMRNALERRRLRAAVHHHRQIHLAGDVAARLDVDRLHHAALGAGLVRHEGLAEQALRDLLRLVGRADQLDAARLAATTGVDLHLDDAERNAQVREGLAHFGDGRAGDALADGDAELRQELLGLILVDVHGFEGRAR